MVNTKSIAALAASLILSSQVALACPPDKKYWVEGTEPFFGSYCDLKKQHVGEYEDFCSSYCTAQSDRTCYSDPNLQEAEDSESPYDSGFKDLFNTEINKSGRYKHITSNGGLVVSLDSTDACVTEYTCQCFEIGVVPGDYLVSASTVLEPDYWNMSDIMETLEKQGFLD